MLKILLNTIVLLKSNHKINYFCRMKRVNISVINDLVTDQRVHKVCNFLKDIGFEVLLIGRKLPQSPEMDKRQYETKRMKLLFRSGPLFYACFNLRLFFLLLFRKADLLVSNDLDTLLANYLVSKIKGIPLVYDSHEYFTEVPELEGRKARKVWLAIENYIFPKLKEVITVNDSIAKIYKEKYGVDVKVVRNLPSGQKKEIAQISKTDLGVSENQKIVILQGSGINLDRGGEEAVLAMKAVENAVLLVVGSGDALPELKRIVEKEGLHNKVKFIPRQKPDYLYGYTVLADVGLSLDKDTNLNYRYSLPNKIFDYIHCGVPVLASDLPEVARIIRGYDAGIVLKDYSVNSISNAIKKMLTEDFKSSKTNNLKKASLELTWETNREVLNNVYIKYL